MKLSQVGAHWHLGTARLGITVIKVHPIERLRSVARASGIPQDMLLEETATALASFADDPAGLLTACRRMLSRKPESGALVWLAARMISSPDPRREAWLAVEESETDGLGRRVARAIESELHVATVGWPESVGAALARRGDVSFHLIDRTGQGWRRVERLEDRGVTASDVDAPWMASAVAGSDLLLLEAVAAGPGEALVPVASVPAAAVARAFDVTVWLVVPTGAVLPDRMWQGLVGRYEADRPATQMDFEVLPLSLVDQVVGPARTVSPADIAQLTSCPVTPELFR